MKKKNKLKKIGLAKTLDALTDRSCTKCDLKYQCFHNHKSVKTWDNMITCSKYETKSERMRITSGGSFVLGNYFAH